MTPSEAQSKYVAVLTKLIEDNGDSAFIKFFRDRVFPRQEAQTSPGQLETSGGSQQQQQQQQQQTTERVVEKVVETVETEETAEDDETATNDTDSFFDEDDFQDLEDQELFDLDGMLEDGFAQQPPSSSSSSSSSSSPLSPGATQSPLDQIVNQRSSLQINIQSLARNIDHVNARLLRLQSQPITPPMVLFFPSLSFPFFLRDLCLWC